MGHSYDRQGRLCCDCCAAAPAESVPCPFHACPPAILCPACKEKHRDKLTAAYHRAAGCERFHAEYVARQNERRALLASGRAVRCAALGTREGVHVLFESLSGAVGFFMAEETYRAIPLLQNATVEEFQALGELRPAPAAFYA